MSALVRGGSVPPPGQAVRLVWVEIRRLVSGEGGQLRDVRLRALANAPYAFSSSLEREAVLGAEFWEHRVAESDLGEDGVVFVAADDGRSIGMAGGFFVDEEHEVAMLWGMWVDPSARRGGLGQGLLEAVAGWAQDSGAHRLRLAVTDCEASGPAAALYRKLAFVDTGEQEPLEWSPSLTARIMSRSF
jgi:GNAT superfamily N-acetyltransferase